MTAAGEETRGENGEERAVVYCVVPRDLVKLHEPLRRHFQDSAAVEVVVERRNGERREGEERRSRGKGRPAVELRRIRNLDGRRIAERRASVVSVAAPALPRRVQRHAGRLTFLERFEPSSEHAEDIDTARLVTRVQAGDQVAFADLYLRYFDRVYGYLRVILKNPQEAEDLTQQVFMDVLEKLDFYERRRQPFRAWLFVVVRNYARNHILRERRIDLTDPAELSRRLEQQAEDPSVQSALSWITDRELLFLIERLPLPQRQVLVMRFMLDLPAREIAKVLDCSPNHVSVLQYRALAFLEERLTALGRAPRDRGRTPRMTRCPQKATVLRLRRFALQL